MKAQHPSDQTLNQYRMGKLDDGSAETVKNHLETCPECQIRAAMMSSASFLDWVGGCVACPSALLRPFSKRRHRRISPWGEAGL
jgi:anti-sigma factor RsiW